MKDIKTLIIVNTDLLHCGPQYNVECPSNIESYHLQTIKNKSGPIMIIVKIKSKKISSERITHKPLKIKSRFMDSI